MRKFGMAWGLDALARFNGMVLIWVASAESASGDRAATLVLVLLAVLLAIHGVSRTWRYEKDAEAASRIVAMMDSMRDGRLVYFPPEK